MSRNPASFVVLGAVALLGLLALPAQAAETGQARALGADGTFYQVLDGTRAQLFGPGEGDVRVLALEVVRPSAQPERLLVPGTDTWRRETDAQVFVDGDAVLLVWRQGTPSGDFSLHFQSWHDGEWQPGGQVEVGATAYLFDTEPTLLITREAYTYELDDATTAEVRRAIIHVVWQSRSGDVRYVALPFVDGEYVGWHEPVALTRVLVKSNAASNAGGGAVGPAIVACRVLDGKPTVSVTLDDPLHHHLATLHVEALPMELAVVGDAIRDEITSLGTEFEPGRLGEYRDKMLGRAVWIGHKLRLSPAVLDFLTSRLGDWILGLAGYPGDLGELAADARSQAIELGRTVYAKGVVDPADLGGGMPELDLADDPDSNGHREALDDLVRFDLRSDVETPAVGVGDVTVHASDDGRSLLVAWHNPASGRIEWVEHRGAGWSEPRALSLSAVLDLDAAQTLLRDAIR